MELDRIDRKILWELDYDARKPLSEIAESVGVSKQNAAYRLKKLVENGAIRGFMSVVDINKLGYLPHRVYFRYKNVNAEKEKGIINYFKKHENVLWLVSTSGAWDLEAVFIARNFVHFNNLLKKIKEEMGKYFSKYNTSMSVVNYHFKRDYLIGCEREGFSPYYYGFEPEKTKLDALDAGILAELSRNCRQNSHALGNKLGVTYHTVKDRIKRMEKSKVIQSHRVLIDLDKVGRTFWKGLFWLNNPTRKEEAALYDFCMKKNFVAYLVEVFGDWQLEVETEVAKSQDFTDLIRGIRNEFPDLIRDYEILQVTKEHKLNYLPMGTKITRELGA